MLYNTRIPTHTNLAFGMNIIGEDVLLARNYPLHSYSFNNKRPMQDRLFKRRYTLVQIQIIFANASQNKPDVFPSADAFRGKILRTTVQTKKKNKQKKKKKTLK